MNAARAVLLAGINTNSTFVVVAGTQHWYGGRGGRSGLRNWRLSQQYAKIVGTGAGTLHRCWVGDCDYLGVLKFTRVAGFWGFYLVLGFYFGLFGGFGCFLGFFFQVLF